MNRTAAVSFAFLLSLTLFTVSCSSETPAPTPTAASPTASEPAPTNPPPTAIDEEVDVESLLSAEPSPASIDITLEEGAAVSAEIGSEGGVLETVDANGTLLRLTIPEGALLSPELIMMTPIARAEGEAMGNSFLAGADLHPDGLHFFELVTLEITGPVIEVGAVGFSTEGDGQDLHLTPSSQTADSLTITFTHFSEGGAGDGGLVEHLRNYIPLEIAPRVLIALAQGSDEAILDALQAWSEWALEEGGSVDSFEQWKSWSASVLSLLIRVVNTRWTRNWDNNTPGISELADTLKSLLVQWILISNRIIGPLVEKCKDGNLEESLKVLLIAKTYARYTAMSSEWFTEDESGDSFGGETLSWDVSDCSLLGLTWQANVHTMGSSGGETFYSYISLAAEYEFFDIDDTVLFDPSFHYKRLPLVVDYIEGAFSICATQNGRAELGIRFKLKNLNFKPSPDPKIEEINVAASINEQVNIDCSNIGPGMDVSAQAQRPFHGEALEKLNKDRLVFEGTAERWVFELEYDPGSGLVAQFSEENDTLTWSEGTYELDQLITVWVPDL